MTFDISLSVHLISHWFPWFIFINPKVTGYILHCFSWTNGSSLSLNSPIPHNLLFVFISPKTLDFVILFYHFSIWCQLSFTINQHAFHFGSFLRSDFVVIFWFRGSFFGTSSSFLKMEALINEENFSGGFSYSYLRYLVNIKHDNIFGSWYDHYYLNYGDCLVLDSPDKDPSPLIMVFLMMMMRWSKNHPKVRRLCLKVLNLKILKCHKKRILPKWAFAVVKNEHFFPYLFI